LKNLAILGSTGSIGKNTLEIVSRHIDRYRIRALAVRSNIEDIEAQVRQFSPDVVAVFDESAADALRKRGLPVEVLSGPSGMQEAASLDSVDTVVCAIAGSAGLMPAFGAIRAGKNLALATKEALVMAGHIIMSEARRMGVSILPVDSEHSAIFQCLDGRSMDEVEKIILTASGGPFLKKSRYELEAVTPGEALNHPNWDMGRKISIDSATLMNKGLEVIEACRLFDVPAEKIDVVLHPQSIIHSMVRYIDGSVIAQMSVPDMKGPISYALSYPDRFDNVLPALDLAEVGELTFERPDHVKYPSLDITYEALQSGGTMPCVLNAANEVAVDAFLESDISFTDITRIVSETMRAHDVISDASIEDVLNSSEWASRKAAEIVRRQNVT